MKSEEGSEGAEYEDVDAGMEDAKDLNGQPLLDASGRSMVKICEDEDVDDVGLKQEMEDLQGLDRYFPRLQNNDVGATEDRSTMRRERDGTVTRSDATAVTASPSAPPEAEPSTVSSHHDAAAPAQPGPDDDGRSDAATATPTPSPGPGTSSPQRPSTSAATVTPPSAGSKPSVPPPATSCSICSLTNPPHAPTCAVCGHVLDTRKDPRHWRCRSETCRGSEYVNAGDAGVCGVCGERKPST